jgi:predicted ester cyclase
VSEPDLRALLDRYIEEVWNQANPAAVTAFVTPGYRRHLSATAQPLDAGGQLLRLQGFRTAFPDATITIEDTVIGGDLIAFRSVMRGTHQGEFMGIPATGVEIEVGLLDLIRVEGGRFAEQWGGPDLLDLVRQLGGTVVAAP